MPRAALIKARAAAAPDQSGGDSEAMHYRRSIMQRNKTKRTLQAGKPTSSKFAFWNASRIFPMLG
jgi:hypothetical protein